ncbi:huntingtin-interacting protein 1 isoform X1 [Rhopalosiphum maidis]|uniref:huntingtin-interacting protein 1 isoform X1 n=1 Tax=Rhopalosiphum maidis TaxID=43146 RepID=UPI000F009D67|nr:huntingtin-interacting protein 1 isoform X1 [Rhopalosiphum maidis]XP_026813558.1 huntingtin-interacting protein 1 isoform X1 [Rhopalosiphum maidis]XP_026813559.1 huntingtin-interacting protein 1 isoform X1 [Rhopalosiphum maidis]
MSSLSLPRVLQNRKTSLDQEREHFEKIQAASISKAINTLENPVKEKHARNAIIGTFQEKSAETFWRCVTKLPLQEHRIVAWKFCHVLHKVLREGHPNVLASSQRHKTLLQDLGKLWVHLKDGYGKLIQQYCQLLLTKLDFHRRNPGFPGNLVLSEEDLCRIGDNDVNNYFQMCVEMFDYIDEILGLQSAIFGSLDMSRSNSMTSHGQCRLAPLLPCILDSAQLYDLCVKILFKMHATLPPDLLSGHRKRFLRQFTILRQFYLGSSNLQYFKTLIQIPLLPENPPNFLVQAELSTYVTQAAIVLPDEDPSENNSMIGELVDLGIGNSVTSSETSQRSLSPDLLTQRDNMIQHLHGELNAHQSLIIQLKQQVSTLEMELAKKDSELTQERLIRDDLLHQVNSMDNFDELDKKYKLLEEKFNKLKEVYTKLREEHITLLRQKAAVDKSLKGSEKMTRFAQTANSLLLSIKSDVDKQLSNMRTVEFNMAPQRIKFEEELIALQTTVDSTTLHNDELLRVTELLKTEVSEVKQKLTDAVQIKSDLELKLSESEELRFSINALWFECCRKIIEHTSEMLDYPSMSSATCSPECVSLIKEKLVSSIDKGKDEVAGFAHYVAMYIVLGKSVSNTKSDLNDAQKLSDKCKQVGKDSVKLLTAWQTGVKIDECCNGLISTLNDVESMAFSTQANESLGDLVEDELSIMDRAIEEAAKRIQEMITESRAAHSGIKLEVNEQILDSCTSLMAAIRVLVHKSRKLQAEIVANQGSNGSAKEFYKRNHQWTEGLISAAKSIGLGAKGLLDAANEAVSGEGKLERLIVASHCVAAGTAQLVVASRVKASQNSDNLAELSQASRNVTNATATVVATAKSCAQLVQQTEDLDLGVLNEHQTKRLEIECQVRVLELESSLEKERMKLSALRKLHYQEDQS